MKEIIDLQQYKIANNPTTDKENKKVNSWQLIAIIDSLSSQGKCADTLRAVVYPSRCFLETD